MLVLVRLLIALAVAVFSLMVAGVALTTWLVLDWRRAISRAATSPRRPAHRTCQ